MAETTTTDSSEGPWWSMTMSATRAKRSAFPTEVPPNLCTIMPLSAGSELGQRLVEVGD